MNLLRQVCLGNNLLMHISENTDFHLQKSQQLLSTVTIWNTLLLEKKYLRYISRKAKIIFYRNTATFPRDLQNW